jgi:hypothetical protein
MFWAEVNLWGLALRRRVINDRKIRMYNGLEQKPWKAVNAKKRPS